uniref:hypothetical protein n=1 Tax=Aeromonas sp. Ne-1 TaxID=1675689 RepID=UPI001565A187|nr:hypothetical protein [Aeromonas sp. Ne-1]
MRMTNEKEKEVLSNYLDEINKRNEKGDMTIFFDNNEGEILSKYNKLIDFVENEKTSINFQDENNRNIEVKIEFVTGTYPGTENNYTLSQIEPSIYIDGKYDTSFMSLKSFDDEYGKVYENFMEKRLNLDSQEYLSFTTKLINDKQEIGLKMSEHDDIVNLYFMSKDNSSFHKVEFDPVNKTLMFEDKELSSINSLYLNDQMNLIYGDLRSNELIQDINDTVKTLKEQENLNGLTDIFNELSTGMKERVETMVSSINTNSYMSIESIDTLYKDLERTHVSLEKIDHLLDKIEQYKQLYPKNEIQNDDLFNGMASKNAKVDMLSDEWSSIKTVLEKQVDFQQAILKIETENFLTDKAIAYKNFDYDLKNTSIAEYLSNTNVEDVTSKKLIPLSVQANLNDPIDKLENHVNIYKSLEYMNSSFKQLELYGGDLSYKGSSLNEYIEHNKQKEINHVIHLAREEFKNVYGKDFELFNGNDLSKGVNNVISKFEPIIEKKTFSLHELADIEPVNKKDHATRDFWEDKNVQLLENYKDNKGLAFGTPLEDLYLRNKDINLLIEKTPDLLEDKNQFSDKLLNRFKETIEVTESTILSLKQNIKIDMLEQQGIPINNKNSDFYRTNENQQNNNLKFMDSVQNRLEVLKEYINVVEKDLSKEQTKEKQNEKTLELER